jgi:hypothetical protein
LKEKIIRVQLGGGQFSKSNNIGGADAPLPLKLRRPCFVKSMKIGKWNA